MIFACVSFFVVCTKCRILFAVAFPVRPILTKSDARWQVMMPRRVRRDKIGGRLFKYILNNKSRPRDMPFIGHCAAV